MDISAVERNLKNTILGKEMLLGMYQTAMADQFPAAVREAVIAMIELNLTELRAILKDVSACVEKSVGDSWRDNPDRQGGSFSADEIDAYRGW